VVGKVEPLASETTQEIPLAYAIKTSGQNLDASNEVYFEVYSLSGKKANQLIYKSERIKDVNPTWSQFILPLEFAKGFDSPIKIKCIDYKKGQKTVCFSFVFLTLIFRLLDRY
jgi:hypothetical protein